jgi:hypothetical protein
MPFRGYKGSRLSFLRVSGCVCVSASTSLLLHSLAQRVATSLRVVVVGLCEDMRLAQGIWMKSSRPPLGPGIGTGSLDQRRNHKKIRKYSAKLNDNECTISKVVG